MFPRPTLLIACLVVTSLLAVAQRAAAETILFKCRDRDGRVAFSDDPKKFTHCKPLAHSSQFPSKPPAPGSLAAQNSTQYRETTDVRATASGVQSTAPVKPSLPSQKPTVVVDGKGGTLGVVSASPPAQGPRTTRGSVYTVRRPDGVVEYTNVRPRGGNYKLMFSYVFQETCYACDVRSTVDFGSTRLKTDLFRDEISAAALATGVDAALIRAVIHAESAFNPLAVSAKGAQGLMQLMPGTAGDLGVADAFDIAANIDGGSRYLAQMLKLFDGDERRATAAYNAGPGAVKRHGGIPPFAETQVYVERVAQLRERYRHAR